MANHISAQKRNRQSLVRTLINKTHRSETKTMLKQLRSAIEEKDSEKAKALLPKTQAQLDKLAKIGTIKKENASRKNSRLAKQVAAL